VSRDLSKRKERYVFAGFASSPNKIHIRFHVE
jgi:hypothetical protein